MNPATIEAYRNYGIIGPVAIKAARQEAKDELLPRKVCVRLEIAHRKKLIEEGGQCARCGRSDMLTIDHIVPRAILEVMGADIDRVFMPKNLMLLCRPCNGIKSNRLDFSIPATKEILLELLAKL